MKEKKVIVGEFEDEFYAEIARRDLQTAGISSSIFEDKSKIIMLLAKQEKTVQLLIPVTQLGKAKKILERKFY